MLVPRHAHDPVGGAYMQTCITRHELQRSTSLDACDGVPAHMALRDGWQRTCAMPLMLLLAVVMLLVVVPLIASS